MRDPQPARQASRRRSVLEALWVAATVGYGLARAVVVGKTLGKYDVNPWVYGAIDVVTSVPLGISTARAVGSAIDGEWKHVRFWAAIAGAAFIAPDISIFVMGRGVPFVVYVVIVVYVLVAAAIAVRSAVGKFRTARGTQATTATSDASTLGPIDERRMSR